MGYIVLACIVLIIVLLLLMRFRLQLSFDENAIKLHLKILFFKIEIVGNKKDKIKKSDFKIRKFRRRRDKVLKKYRIKNAPKKDIAETAKKKKTSPLALIRDLKDVIIEVVKLVGKYLKIDRFNIKISVGGKDAANVALNYGYVIQSLQYLVTFLEHISNLDKTKNKSAEVEANFAHEAWGADLNICISIRTWQALKIGIKALIGFLRVKMKKSPQKAEDK